MAWVISLKGWLGATLSDEALMQKYRQSGEPQVLAQLHGNCAAHLYHYLLRHCDTSLAADLAQQTWLRVIEKRHLYPSDARFQAWLLTIARNLLVDEWRRQAPLMDIAIAPAVSDPEPSADARLAGFDAALAQLPFAQRDVFMLQQEGFGLQDIANITHTPIETVKTRLRYAREKLAASLGKAHEA